MKRTLLIVSGGLEACPGIEIAKSMGLHVVVSDIDRDAPGFAIADDCITASTYDVDETVAAARNYHERVRPLDGVICVAADVPLTVASVAEAVGLPGISCESAQLAIDKIAMKQCFARDNIPIPWFSEVASARQLSELVSAERMPLVIKPVDSRGSRGVLRLTPEIDLDWAYDVAWRNSPSRRVMVERFLPGPQLSTESLVVNGIAYTIGFSDRNYENLEQYAPHIIEDGGQLPSHLNAATHDAVRSLIQDAAKSMGISNGVVKGDIVIKNGQPHVIELAARLSGGYFCTHEIPLNTGVDFVGSAIRLALGEVVDPVNLIPKFNRPVAQRYMFSRPGVVAHVDGEKSFADHPDVAFLEIRVKPGDYIGPVDSHKARVGVVITTGDTVDAAVSLARQVVDSIVITVE